MNDISECKRNEKFLSSGELFTARRAYTKTLARFKILPLRGASVLKNLQFVFNERYLEIQTRWKISVIERIIHSKKSFKNWQDSKFSHYVALVYLEICRNLSSMNDISESERDGKFLSSEELFGSTELRQKRLEILPLCGAGIPKKSDMSSMKDILESKRNGKFLSSGELFIARKASSSKSTRVKILPLHSAGVL